MTIEDLAREREYETGIETCPGCDNHCTVKTFRFANGRTFHSGNQCERIYSSAAESVAKGVNMFAEKNRLLWQRSMKPAAGGTLRIGIPRALGIYEDFPFWCTLLVESGMEVVLSHGSTNHLYEQGIRTVVADNICFPAKLMHGHVMDLIGRGVDRLLYPWVVFEKKEDTHSQPHHIQGHRETPQGPLPRPLAALPRLRRRHIGSQRTEPTPLHA